MRRRRTEPPPSFIKDAALSLVADYADRLGCDMQRRKDKRAYQYNQIAHWLWRLAGREPSDLEPENENKIRTGRRVQ